MFTYNEPTVRTGFLTDVARAARKVGIRSFLAGLLLLPLIVAKETSPGMAALARAAILAL